MVLVLLVVGLVLLTAGAELLVRGASSLARIVGLSPLVVGLTVVAFGTSAPELAVSVKAGLDGQGGIALGNVIGSNIFNVLLILGISSLILPLIVSKQLIRLDVPVMIGVSALAWLMGVDGNIGRLDGAVLLAIGIAYTLFVIYMGRRYATKEIASCKDETCIGNKRSKPQILFSSLYVLIGLAMLVLGARWLVIGAVDIARTLGISEIVIGLTIVAAGTSLPEVATSIVASLRRERDIAVGNVVGSNIFNILIVLGAAALVSGRIEVAPSTLSGDIPIMVGVTVMCLPIFFTGGRISRAEGILFLCCYGAYLAFILLSAMNHPTLNVFVSAMQWIVLPAITVALCISVLNALRCRRISPNRHGPQ